MKISPDVCHQLPQDRCCNCDSRTELEVLPVEYSLQPGSIAGDAYLGMVLRLPFCARCRPTAKRRRLRATEAFVIGFLLFFLIALILGWASAGSNHRDPLLFMMIAGFVGFGLPFGVPLCLRPQQRQSSFWRPVEIKAIIAKNHLNSLHFYFSSKSYGVAFEVMNASAIKRGALSVQRPN